MRYVVCILASTILDRIPMRYFTLTSSPDNWNPIHAYLAVVPFQPGSHLPCMVPIVINLVLGFYHES